MSNKFFTYLISIFCILVCRAEESIPGGTAWYPEGGDRAPVKIEQIKVKRDQTEFPAVKMTLKPGKGWNKILLPIKADAGKYNTVTFMARLKKAPGLDAMFSVFVLDSKGNWATAHVGKCIEVLPNGDYFFKWDIINQPHVVRSFNVENFNRLAIGYPFPNIPKGQEAELIIYDVKLNQGMSMTSGNPELYKKWRQYITDYKPDYSDSSKYLHYPEQNRLSSALPLANAEIILPPDATAPERKAAEELRYWLTKISGRKLVVRNAPAGSGNTKIHLGRAYAETGYAAELRELEGTDGFLVRNNGPDIYISGATPKGTLNGVFAFLEYNTDIIWARPHAEYGTVFTRNPELEITWANGLERPGSTMRGWLQNAGGGWKDFPAWAIRNRSNYVGGISGENIEWGNQAEIGGGHNLQSFIPKDDPTFYPVVGGKKPDKLSIWKHQICLNAPDLVNIYSKNVIQFIKDKASPGITAMNIKIEDNWGVCECPKCTAPLKLPDGRVLDSKHPAFRSTQFYDFLNKVTEKINAVYPGLEVHTYAYFYTAVPPEINLHPQIAVLFCPYVRKDHRTPLASPINDHWYKMAVGFAQKGKVIVREYYGILTAGRPLAEVAAWDIRDYLSRGTGCFASEISTDGSSLWWDGEVRGDARDWDFNMMEFWVISRLYWTPDADVESLRKHFIRRVFHDAAPEIEQFFGLIRLNYFKDRNPTDWMSGPALVNLYLKKTGKLAEARRLLKTALDKTNHPDARLMIARLNDRLDDYANPAPAVKKKNRTADDLMIMAWDYGWRASGKNCEVRRTVLEYAGKYVPAVHLIFDNKEKGRHNIRTGFKFDASSLKFKFRLIPGENAEKLPEMSVVDSAWKVEKAPASAFSRQEDGSYLVDWQPNGQNINLSKVTTVIWEYTSGNSADFYMTETGLEHKGKLIKGDTRL